MYFIDIILRFIGKLNIYFLFLPVSTGNRLDLCAFKPFIEEKPINNQLMHNMDSPFLTEIFLIISLLTFLIAMLIILPTLINSGRRGGYRKKKETSLVDKIESDTGEVLKYAVVRTK